MKNELTATGWLAVNLYYSEPWEDFLVEAVKPYVQTVMKTGIAQHYAFTRYWERGPHIRLRFKGDARVLRNLLKPNLNEHFHNYYDAKPSFLVQPNYPPEFPEQYRWLPNNSIQYIPFAASMKPLGGLEFTETAQQHFQASSDIVLHLLEVCRSFWDSDEALLTAMKLHLSMMHCMGLDSKNINQFFQNYFQNWLCNSTNFNNNNSRNNPQFEISYREQLLKEFEGDYNKHQYLIIPPLERFWDKLLKGESFPDESFNQWLDFNQAANCILRLGTANQSGLQGIPFLLNNLFCEFIHQTNNRLGIHDVGEGYLMYLLMKFLQK